MVVNKSINSAGHGLGQLIGDWWEKEVILPILEDLAGDLNLYVDNRYKKRSTKCRGGKLYWADGDGNKVDYDFVLEMNGTSEVKGIPVAFVESFWRKGARHSKDKARDDTNKLLPMREAYPTARFLAIAACGEFTAPAMDYVKSRGVDLFFVAKESIVSAFDEVGIKIDYPDSMPESGKLAILQDLKINITEDKSKLAVESLKRFSGVSTFESFKLKIKSSLTASPQQIDIFTVRKIGPKTFKTTKEVSDFFSADKFAFDDDESIDSFQYQVKFSDGTEFFREVLSMKDLLNLNNQLEVFNNHIENVLSKAILN